MVINKANVFACAVLFRKIPPADMLVRKIIFYVVVLSFLSPRTGSY